MTSRKKKMFHLNLPDWFLSLIPLIQFWKKTKSDKHFENIRWNVIVFGILVGSFGVGFLSGSEPNWLLGLPIQALAFWILWNAFPTQSRPLPQTTLKTKFPQKIKTNWIWLVLGVIASWVVSYNSFSQNWWIAGLAVFLVLLGMIILCVKRWENLPHLQKVISDNTAIAILIILTALLRFPFINQYFTGFQNDEAKPFLDTLDILKGTFKTPFGSSYGFTFFPPFLIAPFTFVFGANVAVAKGATALISVIPVYFFYRWCRLYFGVGASLMASGFFSYCWWDLFFSLSLYQHISTICFEVITVYFLSKAVKEGGKWNFAWAGIGMAISVLTYASGRIVPVMAALVIFVYWMLEGKRFPKLFWKNIIFLTFFFLLTIGPFLVFLTHKPEELYGRAANISILKLAVQNQAYFMPLERVATTFYTFLFPNNPRVDLRYGLTSVPCLDPYLGLFFLLGLVLAVHSFKQWKNLLALAGILLTLAANALVSESGEIGPFAFHGGRCFFAFPFLCFLMAQGLDWSIRFFSGFSKKINISFKVVLVLLVACSAYANIDAYYFKFRNTKDNYFALGYNHISVVELFKRYGLKDHVVVEGIKTNEWGFRSGSFDLIDRVLTMHNVPLNEDLKSSLNGCYSLMGGDPANGIPVNLGWPLPIPIRAQVTKSVVIFFPTWDEPMYEPEKEKVRQFYPNALWEIQKNQYGEVIVKTVEIKMEDIQNLQKGMNLDAPLF